MSITWMTKYGPRRVRQEPPTLAEAIYAAEGLSDDLEQQIVIAADLIQAPVEDVRAEAERMRKARPRNQTLLHGRRSGPIVVERRAPRRFAREIAAVAASRR